MFSFALTCMCLPTIFYVVVSYILTPKNEKPWQKIPNWAYNTIYNQPFPGLGNVVIHLL
jgi:hypothetical protein